MKNLFVFGLIAWFWSAPAGAAEIIELTQTPCQFLEVEKDLGFKSTKKADCEQINAQTATERLKQARVITVKPGDYIFRVRNKNVPYELGFWLRDVDYDWRNPLHKLTKTSVSGGGLTLGKSKDYAVTLKPGKYLYSCPLNTTPDYTLIVKSP
ncbi:MAG: hypothetical protein COB59_08125 [Rhodospirillaceae bacterium]|nr:MAG: hypothetical protein COB59_08125 [Rhodospirillaceae bacterium]